MTTNTEKFHSLSRRIVVRFCVFTLLLCAVFGLLSFMLMYNLEDRFMEKEIQQEANVLAAHYQETGQWPKANKPNMQLHFSKETFPDEIREMSIEEPRRKEFFGKEGRHYHVLQFSEYPDTYLVAEVSANLLVRPIRDGIIMLLVFSAIIVTIIACIIAWLIGRKMTQPLEQLAELVGGVAPEHIPDKFAYRFPENEIGILAHTLENTFQRMTQALEREKCFTRDVSHELRTPLAVIKNALELYRSKKVHSAPENPIITRIHESAEQMEKTVHTLLMLAREEQTKVTKEPTQLMPVIERSVLDNRLLLQGKEVDIKIQDSCKVTVYGQPGMLKVLLDNLLSNAFQYTAAGEVSVDFVDGSLVVSDTGPGIDQTISENATVSGVKGRQSTGFGLGLSIVSRLCEHQGWQLEVMSGNGTKVTVTLSSCESGTSLKSASSAVH
ncbi:MAG: sensor histidine kinase [Aestuariibacter sp.]